MVAIVLGATGLVGESLLNLLLENARVDKIICLSRREIAPFHAKIENVIVDFSKPFDLPTIEQNACLFITFGTTIKKAKTQAKQYEIDVTYPKEVMEKAKQQGVETCVLVSSIGANKNAKIFYSRIKGELEEIAKELDFTSLTILRPSMLDGNRKEKRTGEKFGLILGRILSFLLGKYKPIKVQKVAQTMLAKGVEAKPGIHILESNQI